MANADPVPAIQQLFAALAEIKRLQGRHDQLLYWLAKEQCNCYHEDGRDIHGGLPQSITADWHLEDCPFWHCLNTLKADESEG